MKWTFADAQHSHLTRLAGLGWTVNASLKVPHATRGDGLRLWFKPQAVYVSTGTNLGDARSLHCDPRTITTEALVIDGERTAKALEL